MKHHWIKQQDGISENMDYTFRKIYETKIVDGAIVTEGSLSGISVVPYLRFTQKITVDENGAAEFEVKARVNEQSFWLQRFGYEFSFTDPDAAFCYFGVGPGESYVDLKNYEGLGLWESSASKEYVPYTMPQEHGNHYGVRFLSFENGLQFMSDSPFECNISQFGTMELLRKKHAAELVKDGVTHVRIDYKDSGIGSGSCGPQLLDPYKLSEKDITFKFQMKF